MLEKLPILQKFLAFISNTKNVLALVVLLLFVSIYFNYKLAIELNDSYKSAIEEKEKSISYERERSKSSEDIIKELLRKAMLEHEQDSIP